MTRPTHHALLATLNRQSVAKHYDAYADIDWDAPDHRVDPDDPRWERPADSGLGRTEWYRALAPTTRARLGLHLAMSQMRLGIDFESVLSRGLLEFASTAEPGSPELRYAYHEVIEESQHSLMFQELVARAGLPVRGLTGLEAWGSRRVTGLGRTFPELFFVHVLGGEVPIDHQQKVELARRDALHPLIRRVMQVHVTEEARHLAFAHSFLRARVPQLPAWRMLRLRIATPFTLGLMARQMLEPPRWLLDLYHVPQSVRREAFRDDVEHRRRLAVGLEPVRELCREVGIATPAFEPLWRAMGIWADPAPGLPSPTGLAVDSTTCTDATS